MNDICSLLVKVRTSPGLCTHDEILVAKTWVESFNEQLKIYKAAYGEPLGYSVEMTLKDLAWYEDFHSKKGIWKGI